MSRPSNADCDLRLGTYQNVLANVGTVNAVVCDPPYGARVHNADGARADGARADGLAPTYKHWGQSQVYGFVEHWTGRCDGWIVALTCSQLADVWQQAFLDAGWYGFAPLPCVMRGMSVRLAGDGPSSWAVYACVGRPRTKAMSKWGTLPGAYIGGAQPGAGGGRGKPGWLMRDLIRDYTKPGDLVCDPVAGWGSTALACLAAGRRFVGAEMDEAAYEEAQRRIRTGDWRKQEWSSDPAQMDLLGGVA